MSTLNRSLPSMVRIALVVALSVIASSATYAQNDDLARPPTVGSASTSSEPASLQASSEAVSGQNTESATSSDLTPQQEVATNTGANRLFGKTKITERKRENGQVYSIELEHSSGAKQYIEDNDADGINDSNSNNIDDNPGIAKWRLGSW